MRLNSKLYTQANSAALEATCKQMKGTRESLQHTIEQSRETVAQSHRALRDANVLLARHRSSGHFGNEDSDPATGR